MKALFISNDPNIFDAGSPVYARLRAYAGAIGELHVLSRGRSGAQERHEGALSVYPVTRGGAGAFLRLLAEAKRLIREKGIEVVSAQDPFEHGYLALRAVRGTDAKLHIQIHTDFLSPYFAAESVKNRVRVFIAGRVLPEADGIRAVSERIRKSLSARYGSKLAPVSVIPLMNETVATEAGALPPHGFSFSLFAVSRLEKEKRVDDILGALALVRRTHPDTGLFLAGTGREERKLQERAGNLGLEKNVIFLGWRKNAASLMKQADAFVQAGAYEGYGASLIEAAEAGLPVVSTDAGIVGEVLMPEKDLLAVPPMNKEKLAAAILRLIGDEALRRALAASAKETAVRHLASLGNVPSRIALDLRLAITRS